MVTVVAFIISVVIGQSLSLFFKILEDTSPFCGATDTLVLDFSGHNLP